MNLLQHKNNEENISIEFSNSISDLEKTTNEINKFLQNNSGILNFNRQIRILFLKFNYTIKNRKKDNVCCKCGVNDSKVDLKWV
jgi:hypothetical protein